MGHLTFIRDIVNKCEPGTFECLKDASEAFRLFQRKIHEGVNADKRKMKNNV
jgi:hypothetical protein